jgi:predicted ArsR family transcriptional regulator
MKYDHRRPSTATARRVWAAVTRRPQATVRELADELGLSHDHVNDALAMLGYVEHEAGDSRARTVIVPLHTCGFRIVRRADS